MDLLSQSGYSIVVGHFNHQLRPEAAEDAQRVEAVTARFGIPFRVGTADVRGHAESSGISIEDAARRLRYRYLFALAHECKAQAVAVGHTADDQVETVLMHILRGSGLNGLQGMAWRVVLKEFDSHIPLVRPMLDTWRWEIAAYCASHDLEPAYDLSNESLEFTRNRIRHLLIPVLEEYNPNFRETLLRLSKTVQADYGILREVVEKSWRDCVLAVTRELVTFDADRLLGQARGMKRNLIRLAILELSPQTDVKFSTLERACQYLEDSTQRSPQDLQNGLFLFLEASRAYVGRSRTSLPVDFWPQLAEMDSIPLPVPGAFDLGSGWTITTELLPIEEVVREHVEQEENGFQAWLDADTLSEELGLRTRRDGDSFRPMGFEGHSQKLSDFMVNEKLPFRARDRWPLLCDGSDIVWIAGYRLAHPFRLTESTQEVIHVSLFRQRSEGKSFVEGGDRT
ncbi:MAG: tRNA lysidine(34) synthetase TilS [Chloroflexi bacterium]|nr:tRNA lysidine(34) synthetase TilS [Chloroflexota bacterium]